MDGLLLLLMLENDGPFLIGGILGQVDRDIGKL